MFSEGLGWKPSTQRSSSIKLFSQSFLWSPGKIKRCYLYKALGQWKWSIGVTGDETVIFDFFATDLALKTSQQNLNQVISLSVPAYEPDFGFGGSNIVHHCEGPYISRTLAKEASSNVKIPSKAEKGDLSYPGWRATCHLLILTWRTLTTQQFRDMYFNELKGNPSTLLFLKKNIAESPSTTDLVSDTWYFHFVAPSSLT